jgi:DnaJ-class molecular chaperone
MNFHERKKQRTKHFEKNVKGWKERHCTACNGSGYYDHNGSPPCGACGGTGKEKYKPNKKI